MEEANKLKIRDQNQAKISKPEVRYRAFYLSIAVIRFLESLPAKNALRIISDQLIRCVTSIGANIVEAKASASKREFLNYFHIALKSTNETKYWLTLIRELIPEHRDIVQEFINEAEEIGKIVGSSILTMKGKRTL